MTEKTDDTPDTPDTPNLPDTVDLNDTGLVPSHQALGQTMGRGLIKAAQQENRKALHTALVNHVQEIQVQLKKQRDYQANAQANVDTLLAMLAAIDAGAITVATYGRITFTDPALNAKNLVFMLECPNCGYNRDVRPRG